MEVRPTVLHRPRSLLSTLALGARTNVVVVILGGAGIIVYAMNITDRKTDDFTGLVEQAVTGLPEFQKSLPPILADTLMDRRQPAQVRNLRITTRQFFWPRAVSVPGRVDREGLRLEVEITDIRVWQSAGKARLLDAEL